MFHKRWDWKSSQPRLDGSRETRDAEWIYHQLTQLDLETATSCEVGAILDRFKWFIELKCSCCNRKAESAVVIHKCAEYQGDEPTSITICAACRKLINSCAPEIIRPDTLAPWSRAENPHVFAMYYLRCENIAVREAQEDNTIFLQGDFTIEDLAGIVERMKGGLM